jgi:prepilin-type N-terminal cleavage/methylation domain-containing protein/prepilin-type processing-associated H-X9-DG protein
MLNRRKGFTLIELLVVIAIIGILASMVFPVFARARESARKVVCLSNVKNIALAIQMYLADNNDSLPPSEHRAEVLDYFDTCPGGKTYNTNTLDHCHRARQANPYLRWPVVLDEYTKNRDVWRCPSAKVESGAGWIIGPTDWFNYLVAMNGAWGTGNEAAPCGLGWPNGWGGDITDTIAQNDTSAVDAHRAFKQSIGTAGGEDLLGMKLVQVEDPVRFIICADAGVTSDDFSAGNLAYPDICALDCGNSQCGWVDWEIASDPNCCGDDAYNFAPSDGSYLTDPELRKQFARHLGGVNLGFLDGHAAWWNSTGLLNAIQEEDLLPIGPWGPVSDCYHWDGDLFINLYPDVPTLW